MLNNGGRLAKIIDYDNDESNEHGDHQDGAVKQMQGEGSSGIEGLVEDDKVLEDTSDRNDDESNENGADHDGAVKQIQDEGSNGEDGMYSEAVKEDDELVEDIFGRNDDDSNEHGDHQ